MINVLFNPQGRIDSGPFWRGAILLLVVSVVARVLQMFVLNPGTWPYLVLFLIALTYPLVCVYAKRFRDAGMSGWWVFATIFAQMVVVGGIRYLMTANTMLDLQVVQSISPEWQTMQAEIARRIFVPAQIADIVVALVIAWVVARLPTVAGENRFEPPTTA